MSRAYRVRVSESLRRVYRVGDSVRSELEILPVLPEEQMAEHLKRELLASGFEEAEDGTLVRREDDGIEIRVDPKTKEVSAVIAREVEVDLKKTVEGRVYEENIKQGQERLRQAASRQLEQEAEQKATKAQDEVTAQLEKRLGDLRGELDRISVKVTGEALKQRAAQLGEVQEVSEDEATGELTIRVRV